LYVLKKLTMKKNLLFTALTFLLCLSIKQNAKAQFIPTPINVFDSLTVYCDLPADVYFYVNGAQNNNYLPTDSVTLEVAYGDGTFYSGNFPVYQGGYYYAGAIIHTYTLPGQYTCQFLVTWPDNDVDTLIYGPLTIGPCSNISGVAYIDANNDCLYNTGETVLPYVGLEILNQNGTVATYAYTDSSGNYNISLPIGATFNIGISQYSIVNANVTCPASGTYTVVNTGASQTFNFGIDCQTQYDLQANMSGWRFRPGFNGYIYTSANNASCYPVNNASAVLNLDPIISYVSPFSGLSPISASGQDVNWSNIQTLNYWNNSSFSGITVYTPTTAQMGDSVCFTYSVSPDANDINPANNTIYRCYEVRNSWDPNEKDVYPTGAVPQNTDFEYIVHFQNTGNDTAYNVSIVDTLDADLDFSTLRIIGASHNMSIDVIATNIIKFNFYNIMLPDSGANLAGSQGYVTYKIKANANVPAGTEWRNTAYIYFDFNEAIITNTTVNTLEVLTSIDKKSSANSISVSPNPAKDNITISLNEPFVGAINITDVSGRTVKQITINNQSFIQFSTSNFANGFYFVNTVGNFSSSKKIQVQH
jgi:fimbrial isopeptide formation D2 family protein